MLLLLVGICSFSKLYQIKLTSAKAISPRMLGYGVAVPEWDFVYGPAEPTDVFQFTEVSCKGDEQNLLDCALKSELVLEKIKFPYFLFSE